MARIRSIKPEFWTSEQIVECSTSARLLFIGLWNFCDDYGNHPASARRLKMQVFPGDDFSISDVDGWIQELIHQGLMYEYTDPDEGKSLYWHVTGWKKHQRVDRPNQKYPQPEFDERSTNARRHKSTSTRRTLDERSPPDVDVDVDVDVDKEKAPKAPKRKRQKIKRPTEPTFAPDNLSLEPWQDWTKYRQNLTGVKPLQQASLDKAAEALAKLTPTQQAECVNSSIRNGYQGLFPEKFNGANSNGTGKTKLSTVERIRRANPLPEDEWLDGT